MQKKISLLILNQTGCPVKELSFTTMRLIGIALLSAVFIVLTAVAIFDYTKLKHSVPRIIQDSRALALQSDKIALQRRQLQLLSDDIKSLKKKWTALRHIELKIKDLAGIERIDEASSRFGIGGDASDERDFDSKGRSHSLGR